jgi:hypothetical protein
VLMSFSNVDTSGTNGSGAIDNYAAHDWGSVGSGGILSAGADAVTPGVYARTLSFMSTANATLPGVPPTCTAGPSGASTGGSVTSRNTISGAYYSTPTVSTDITDLTWTTNVATTYNSVDVVIKGN